jgi:hypothetical protein
MISAWRRAAAPTLGCEETNLKKLRIHREIVRQLNPDDMRGANGGMNISLTGGCPSRFCTTGIECSNACGGPTGYCPTLRGCTTGTECP